MNAASFDGLSPLRFSYIVYILKCQDNTFYVGCTSNLANRLLRHEQGKVLSTAGRRPLQLHTYISFPEKHRAFIYEKYLKSGSGRAFLGRHLI